MLSFRHAGLMLAATLALTACETRTQIEAAPAELTSFRLGHVAVITDKATKAPISRDASPQAWQDALKKAVTERFSRIEGDTYYHIGIHLDGYALAPPGVPLIVSPKSVAIFSVTLMSDTEGGKKLNEKPEQITVFETLSGSTAMGSGLTKSSEEQMANLSFNAALAIEDWLVRNPQFFDPNATPRIEILDSSLTD